MAIINNLTTNDIKKVRINMFNDEFRIYAFNDLEREILYKNPNVLKGKVKLSSKDIKVYFYLKDLKKGIGVTDLVRECLIGKGYDVSDPKMFRARKRPNSEEFYETKSFWGYDEYRVDTFSRSLSKLIKVGLIKKNVYVSCYTYEAIIKD